MTGFVTSPPRRTLRIGTRASPLAMAQARAVCALLPDHDPSIVAIRTSGDILCDRSLMDAGGKGLFTKEIEHALAENRIDIAVHSMKDMATRLPDGLMIAAHLPRASPWDALILDRARLAIPKGRAATLSDLPPNAIVGTAALRRQAQLLHHRPDLQITLLRGNVGRRLEQVKSGKLDATILAMAGLDRLQLAHEASGILPPEIMLPAVAQGVICLQIRRDDDALAQRLQPLDDPATAAAATAERAMLAVLDGSCRTPIAGWARLETGSLRLGETGSLRLDALVAAPDGTDLQMTSLTGPPDDAIALGREVGHNLRHKSRYLQTL